MSKRRPGKAADCPQCKVFRGLALGAIALTLVIFGLAQWHG
jgi:hypothetical protein